MGFITFCIIAIIVVFGVLCLGAGAAVLVATAPVWIILFALWLLIFHTFLGIVFVLGCMGVLAAVKA